MKRSTYLLLLSLQLSLANGPAKTWAEWEAEAAALGKAGNYQAEAQAFRRALALAVASNVDERDLVRITTSLGSACADAGDYAEAEREWRRALTATDKTEGKDSLKYALLLGNTSLLPTRAGNYEETITILRMAIAAHERTGSPTVLVEVRERVARMLIVQKKYDEADAVLHDSQAGLARLRTPNNRQLSQILGYRATVRYQQRRLAESVELGRESIRALEEDVGAEHSVLVVPLNNLATTLVKMGCLEEAQTVYERAITVCYKTLGPNHPISANLLENDSFVLRKLGRKHEAKEMALRSRQVELASRRHNGLGLTVSLGALRPDTIRAERRPNSGITAISQEHYGFVREAQ